MRPTRQVDHRWSARQPLENSVEIYAANECVGEGKTKNLGIGGAYVETKVRVAINDCVVLALAVGDSLQRLKASVIWTNANGFGAMFSDVDIETIHTLRHILYPRDRS